MIDFTPFGYQIIESLGNNTYGGRATYKSIRLSDRQPVVIKQFRFAKDSSWEHYKEIEREIKILQSLDHPGIPRYLNHFDTDDGICLVQEYKEAQSLAVHQNFTPGQAKDLAMAILEILVYLQNQSPPVTHRDLKPANILADKALNVYLVDFGFSRIGEGSVAMSSVAAGTFGFMPPEQLHNRKLTKSSDLYSLGVTIICLILDIKSSEIGDLVDFNTSRFCFQEQMSNLSLDFVKWLEKMVETNPDQRFSDAKTAAKALQSISLTRTPQVILSQSVIEFWPSRSESKLSEVITIENFIPGTLLKGELCIAANAKDQPCSSGSHAWISISPNRFESNQVRCKITIDTRRLQANRLYKRWILLHTNTEAKSNPYKIRLKVYTASALSPQGITSQNSSILPYRYLPIPFVTTFIPFFAFWLFKSLNKNVWGGILMEIRNVGELFGVTVATSIILAIGGLVGAGIGIGLGWITASLLGEEPTDKWQDLGAELSAIVTASLSVAYFLAGGFRSDMFSSTEFWMFFGRYFVLTMTSLICFVSLLITSASTVARKCHDNGISRWDKIILSRLIPAFGISSGVALMAGFTNPVVIFALAATALPVIKVVASQTFTTLRYKDLIEP